MTADRDDIYGRRARIGYISPPLTTEVFPYEFYQMVPAGVTLVLTTLAVVERSKDEVDRSYDISMQAAREMAAAGVDIVVLGGVPINLPRGHANAQQMTAQQAIVWDALRRCGVNDPVPGFGRLLREF